jgi:hypothetical protein
MNAYKCVCACNGNGSFSRESGHSQRKSFQLPLHTLNGVTALFKSLAAKYLWSQNFWRLSFSNPLGQMQLFYKGAKPAFHLRNWGKVKGEIRSQGKLDVLIGEASDRAKTSQDFTVLLAWTPIVRNKSTTFFDTFDSAAKYIQNYFLIVLTGPRVLRTYYKYAKLS